MTYRGPTRTRACGVQRALTLAAILLVTGACTDAPFTPDAGAATPGDDPPPPAFLIGNSPLIRFVKIGNGNTVRRTVEYEAEVTRGFLEARTDDQFLIRNTVSFSKDGGQVADIGACIEKPTPLKQTELNRGGSVGVIMDIDIPAPAWAVIIGATPVGQTIDVHVKIELLLVDGGGKTHVLDTVDAKAAIDPQTAA
jgi:hypothetical protein